MSIRSKGSMQPEMSMQADAGASTEAPAEAVLGSSPVREMGIDAVDEQLGDFESGGSGLGSRIGETQSGADRLGVGATFDSETARSAHAVRMVRQKEHSIAALLAFFLGMFGMHKFYLGYHEPAFVMLSASIIGGIVTFGLASGVVWVIAIIEGIIYLTKSQADFDRIYVMHRREWF